MITGIVSKYKDENYVDWQKLLAKAIRDPLELLKMLDLDEGKYRDQLMLDSKFKLFVTRSYVQKIKKGDWNDPLLKQILPIKEEAQITAGFMNDPVDIYAEDIDLTLKMEEVTKLHFINEPLYFYRILPFHFLLQQV